MLSPNPTSNFPFFYYFFSNAPIGRIQRPFIFPFSFFTNAPTLCFFFFFVTKPPMATNDYFYFFLLKLQHYIGKMTISPTSWRINTFSWLVDSLHFHSMKLWCYKLHRIRYEIFIERRFVKISSKNCSSQIAHCGVESMRILVINVDNVV